MKTRVKQRLFFATILIPILVLILLLISIFSISSLRNITNSIAIIILFSNSFFAFLIINSFSKNINQANFLLNDLLSLTKNNLSSNVKDEISHLLNLFSLILDKQKVENDLVIGDLQNEAKKIKKSLMHFFGKMILE